MADTPPRFIVDPDRGRTFWFLADIYGASPTGAYVPNPDDAVLDWDSGFKRVAAVDYTTGLSDLRDWTLPRDPEELDPEDVLLGVGPGYTSETWRVYIDTRVDPHILQVDDRLHLYGTQSLNCKIFRGTDITNAGEVVSLFYDQTGAKSENIPLELVRTPDANNTAIKAVKTGYTTSVIQDGELLTLVIYGEQNNVMSKCKLLAENTSMTRRTEASLKYVTGIGLKTPFLSEADNTIIEFPININIATVVMQGIVYYSDGSTIEMPIGSTDNAKFALLGLDSYVSTIEGDRLPLTLRYRLSADEYAYNTELALNGDFTVRMFAKSVKADNSYSVKLFMYPRWTGPINGYELDFWLYSLDRGAFYQVPRGLVELQGGSASFDGLDFLSVQRLTVGVSLNKVDPKYSAYQHVQSFEVALKAPGSERRTNWNVAFSLGQRPYFGENLEAPVTFYDTNRWTVNLKNNFEVKEAWLRTLFYGIVPLWDTQTETEAPAPTHFVVHTARRQVKFPIDMWDQNLDIVNDLAEGEVLYIEWQRQMPDTVLSLGMTGLPVHQVN